MLTNSHAVQVQFDFDKLPQGLKAHKRFVIWHAGSEKENGKFAKIPVDLAGGYTNGRDPKCWMSFDAAKDAYEKGLCSGIGIALCDEPVSFDDNGQPLYLVALDFDGCDSVRVQELKKLRKDFGGIYGEVSPSGHGIRMLALSRTPIRGGNAGEGREIYGDGRFVTLTGSGGRGWLIDATEKLQQLEQEWFPAKAESKLDIDRLNTAAIGNRRPETPENIDRVQSQLDVVSSDCDYELWRDVVWSVLSSGWNCAEQLARDWSMKAIHRYDESAFENLVRSFDPNKGISLGTLHHHATQAGWATDVESKPGMKSSMPMSGMKLLTAEQIKSLPELPYRVRGLLPSQGLAACYGQSGSGKSFLAMDLVLAVAAGFPDWFVSNPVQVPWMGPN